MVLLSISLLCNRWMRQQDTNVTNRTKPKCKQQVMDSHEACHDVSEAGSCYWVVHLQHSEEWLDGDQPLPASSSAQGMQSQPVTGLTRYRTASQIARCLFLGWVQWLCALVFSYWKHLGRCEVSVLEPEHTLSPDTVPHLREAVSTLSRGAGAAQLHCSHKGVRLYKCHLNTSYWSH